MYLVNYDLIKKKIGAGANFGDGGPETQLIFNMAYIANYMSISPIVNVLTHFFFIIHVHHLNRLLVSCFLSFTFTIRTTFSI